MLVRHDPTVLRLAATVSVLRATEPVLSTSGAGGRSWSVRLRRKDNVRSSTTLLALIGAALVAGAGVALAAGPATPVVCGSSGCTPLPTVTLHGLLTLPDALRPAEPPEAQPFVVFRVVGAEGATHEVVYVARAEGALLGFAGEAGWRVVPVDDARLLADAAAGTTPYAAPHADTALGGLFAEEARSGWVDVAWIAFAVLLGLAVLGVAVRATTRRGRRA